MWSQLRVESTAQALRWRGELTPRPQSQRPMLQQQAHVPAGLLAKLGRASPAQYPAPYAQIAGLNQHVQPSLSPFPPSSDMKGPPANITYAGVGTPSGALLAFPQAGGGLVAVGQLRYVSVHLGTPLWAPGRTGAPGAQAQAMLGPGEEVAQAAAAPGPGFAGQAQSLPTPIRVPVADFDVTWDELEIGETIGQGAFGRVARARWRGSIVAVKTVLAPSSDSLVNDFKAEVAVISALRHPNVLLFMAACVSPSHLALVTELAPQGSLWDLLRRTQAPLPSHQIIEICLGIARGMAYLHSARPAPILHRDLKSANILLDTHGGVKVSDFGLARVKAVAWSMTGGIGTFQWMAPEVLANDPYTESADVYSFAVILWEMLTLEVPFSDMAAGGNQLNIALQVMTAGLRPSCEGIQPQVHVGLLKLMRTCWEQDPVRRLTFITVIAQLEEMQAMMATSQVGT